MKNKNIKITIALMILTILSLTSPACADGMIYKFDELRNFQLSSEERQLCFINYEKGTEHMLLMVDTSDLKGSEGVWIFPIPARPDETGIDILKGFPELYGTDIKEDAKDKITWAVMAMQASQIYTIPPLLIFSSYLSTGHRGLTTGIDSVNEVTVHEHVEKMGLTTELISSETADQIYGYLSGKGLELPEESRSIINDYIGEEYSFVVSWISDIEEFTNETDQTDRYYESARTIGVYARFPTEKIFFPLKPTSVYGAREIPVMLYVTGHVTPNIYQGIRRETQVTYHVDTHYYTPEELRPLFNDRRIINDLEYTKIRIRTPSKYLTEDLWMDATEPPGVIVADYVNREPWTWGLACFIVCSTLASLIAGLITFRNQRINKAKFILLGLANFLTIIGFAIATIFVRTKDVKPELEKELRKEKLRAFDMRKIPFVFLYSVTFLVLTMILRILLEALIDSL